MRTTGLALAALLLAASSAHARPAHKKALADYLGPFLVRHLNECHTCHLPEKPGEKVEEGEKPHNPFGERLATVRRELRKSKTDDSIPSRLRAMAGEDADGDGTPNLLELLAGRNPGAKEDRATDAELTRARRLLEALPNRREYAWKPFEPVRRPSVPRVKDAAWAANPIDAFLAEQHELYGLRPRPEAPPEVLLRRVYLDLTGLPPTPEERNQFLADPSPAAYAKVVDRLLESPRHGERWARHWMDVWRYVDFGNSGLQDGWTGAPHMWRWRDWIIDALNADKGYDRMVQEMLAGDELAPDDPQALAATAYLARNKSRSRDNMLHDGVNHTARAFLAVTMECARCHDHLYDPVKQVEYYQLRAVFEPLDVRTDPPPGGGDPKKTGLTRVLDGKASAPTYLYVRGVEQNPDKSKVIPAGVPALLGTDGFQVAAVTLGGGKTSTGRRLALARWITRRDNPLAARVAVNHVWLRHFGQAVVPSVFDFGAAGQPPSHPALLDWLAAELMERGWSMKHLHRLIVTSRAYRTASTPDADNLTLDPDNVFLWRMPTRRMEAEAVRDSILHAAGTLDLTMKGPEIDPKRAMQVPRRSVYFRYTDSDYLRVLESFDPPAVEDCYRRPESIVPQQALTLLNSDLVLSQSRRLARQLEPEAKAAEEFVRLAFERVLSRRCTPAEEKTCLDFLAEQARLFAARQGGLPGTADRADATRASSDPALRARENLVHLLFNHHDFVTVR